MATLTKRFRNTSRDPVTISFNEKYDPDTREFSGDLKTLTIRPGGIYCFYTDYDDVHDLLDGQIARDKFTSEPEIGGE